MLHPVIGWPVERLLLHLDAARDEVAVLSPSASLRSDVAARLKELFGAETVGRPQFATADQFWPAAATTWLDFSPLTSRIAKPPAPASGPPYAAAAFPKLNILLDTKSPSHDSFKPQWSAIVRRLGRGPTLRLQTADVAAIHAEVAAAIESVWPI
jgi:hypothetical protein